MQDTNWNPEVQYDSNINWPDYQLFLADVSNYVEPVPNGVPAPAARSAIAYFGMVDMFREKFEAADFGGPFTLRANFDPPDLETAVAAYITDGDADEYDLDAIVAFFRSWGFEPVLLQLPFPQADIPAPEPAPAPAPVAA